MAARNCKIEHVTQIVFLLDSVHLDSKVRRKLSELVNDMILNKMSIKSIGTNLKLG
jgi:hypothetical protein